MMISIVFGSKSNKNQPRRNEEWDNLPNCPTIRFFVVDFSRSPSCRSRRPERMKSAPRNVRQAASQWYLHIWQLDVIWQNDSANIEFRPALAGAARAISERTSKSSPNYRRRTSRAAW